MASNDNSASKSDGNGAAEEPSSFSNATYDPTVFQPPHPDDRGDKKPRKKDEEEHDKDNDKGKTKSAKGKAAGRCANCDAEGATRTCTQCRAVVYCDEKCQKVREQSSSREGCPARSRHSRPAPRRCTGGTAATRRPARPTCSPTPSTRSTSGCAGRRWRPTVA